MAIRSGIQGGRRLKRFIREAKRAPSRSAKSVDVGFFSSAKYPDGTPVAFVAVINEFGTSRIPERPFFRNAIDGAHEDLLAAIKAAVDPIDMEFTTVIAGRVGLVMQGRIQKSITTLREPPNAPSTIVRKKGKSNPLINTGFMRGSVTFIVNE